MRLSDRTDKRLSRAHHEWIDYNHDEIVDINIILDLWDDATRELFQILIDAFSRFQNTMVYRN